MEAVPSSRPTVVVTNWIHDEALERLRAHATVIANRDREPWPPEILQSHLHGADGVVAFMPDRIDRAVLERAPRLRIIACALKGCDNFDLAACAERGVAVTIVEDLLTVPCAELTIGMMIALGRHVLEADAAMRAEEFKGWRPRFYGLGLAGAVVGFVGMGAIGRAIAERLTAFGCTLRYFDPRRLDDAAERALNVTFAPLDDVLTVSDYVVLAVPLVPETLHLIDARRLSKCKKGALLVNTARGSLVDERAVADALESGTLGGYAADVFELEDWARADRPHAIDSRLLLQTDRTLLTPHLGSAVETARRAIAEAAIDSVIHYFRGSSSSRAVAAGD